MKDPRKRRILIIALLLPAFSYGAYELCISFTGWLQGYDFAQHYIAASLVLAGEPEKTYQTGDDWTEEAIRYGVKPFRTGEYSRNAPENVYPPVVSVLMIPFALPPFDVSRRVFFIFNVAMTFAAVALLFANRERGRRHKALLFACAATAVFSPFYFGQYLGQINIIILFLLALGLHSARKDRQVTAGLCIGLGAAIKIFPGILALFFLLKRQYRAAVATVASALLFTAVSLVVYTPAFLSNYLTKFLPSTISGGSRWRNQGITGFFSRLFTESEYSRPLTNLPILACILTPLCSLAIVLIVAAFAGKPRSSGSRIYEIEFAAFLAVAIVILPKSWTHMAVFLLPAYFFVVDWMLARSFKYALLWFPVIASFGIWAFLFTGLGFENVPHTLAGTFYVSANFYASITLLIVLLWAIRRESAKSGEDRFYLRPRAGLSQARQRRAVGTVPSGMSGA